MPSTNAPSAETHESTVRHIHPASMEIIEMLAGAPNVLEFKPSESATARVWDLVAREKEGTLTTEEQIELDHYGQLEHIMRLVKAHARKRHLSAR